MVCVVSGGVSVSSVCIMSAGATGMCEISVCVMSAGAIQISPTQSSQHIRDINADRVLNICQPAPHPKQSSQRLFHKQ